MYYKCYKINPSCGGSYKDSSDWIKNKKAAINSINKKDKKSVQYNVTLVLSQKFQVRSSLEIGKNSERPTKIKAFINKYNWEAINYQSGKDDPKKMLLIFCILKSRKFILPMFQNVTQSVKNKIFF